jgi:peptidoglycan/xylan/chitin deacetylase (PgdA/CDA1 family)
MKQSSLVKIQSLLNAPFVLGCWLGIAGAARRSDGCARVMMFHGTPRRDAAKLERMLRFLKRRFDVVPLDTLVADAQSRGVRFRKQMALTFDDGLRNNFEVAYPLLQKLGLPATFFVCPGLIESGRWLWNQEARERLRSLPPAAVAELANGFGARPDVEAVVGWMKAQRLPARRRAEDALRAATRGFSPTAAQRHAFDVAGWDELRRLDPALATIGAHTLTHPILTTLSPQDAEAEIAQSRTVLEEKLQRPVDLFAYPNGDVDAEVHEVVRRHYRAAVTVNPGFVEPGCDVHLLPRISAPWSTLRVALAVHRPKDYYFTVTPIRASGSQVAI